MRISFYSCISRTFNPTFVHEDSSLTTAGRTRPPTSPPLIVPPFRHTFPVYPWSSAHAAATAGPRASSAPSSGATRLLRLRPSPDDDPSSAAGLPSAPTPAEAPAGGPAPASFCCRSARATAVVVVELRRPLTLGEGVAAPENGAYVDKEYWVEEPECDNSVSDTY